MHTHSLPPSPLTSFLVARLHNAALFTGTVLRYLVLSTVACILYSAPIAFREVSNAQRPVSRS